MAAITTAASPVGRYALIRQAATTAQTDWLLVPAWANAIQIYLSITTAGTNTILTLHSANPVLRDDANSVAIFTGATITAATDHIYYLGTATADGTDAAAADAEVAVFTPSLPALFGVQVAPTGSTYTLSVEFKKT